MGKTYVLLDIFSIPQSHDRCELLVIISFCIYAAAVGFIIIALEYDVHGEDMRAVGHLPDSTISRRL